MIRQNGQIGQMALELDRPRKRRARQEETTAQRYLAIVARWSLIPPDDFMATALDTTQSAIRAARSSASREGYSFESEPVVPPYAWNGQSWWKVTARPKNLAAELSEELQREMATATADELLAIQETLASLRRARK